ncbi:hypothetical protein Y032_0030g2208 [Ancylostoma ceylanicum]|uniref:Uncharacterized protein n=1 Tax=Ancylostoma ceylanicum TaxID=53326 RepID=A0A016US85_9BILA|nr:hypothetical protein Y032_0030g2208 [Ancylostoma ceylanicum]
MQRFDDRLMKVVVTTAERLHFFSAYAPQTGCCKLMKDDFWMLLGEKTSEVPMKDIIAVAGDLNGHLGAEKMDTDAMEALGTELETTIASVFWTLTLTISSS